MQGRRAQKRLNRTQDRKAHKRLSRTQDREARKLWRQQKIKQMQKVRIKMTEIKTEKKIDAATAPKLDARLKELLAGGENALVVDMEDTTYISSVGLRAFVSAQKKLNKSGGTMVLTHVKPCILEIFEVTGFAGVLTIESDD